LVKSRKLRATTDIKKLSDCDIILLTVGTPLAEDLSPDMSAVIKASKALGPNLNRGHMVILKSTAPPGTTEDIVKPLLEENSGLKEGVDFGLAFSPERLAEGTALRDLRTIPVVVGAMDRKSSIIASEFWKSLGLRTIIVRGPKEAEMVKLLGNWWIDLNIALANEIALLSEKVGVDAFELIHASNTLPKGMGKVNILFPGSGVGGSCLVKDPLFVHHMGKKYGLKLKTPLVSREINDYMPQHMFELTKEILNELGKKISGSKIVVLGLAFKSSTGDTRYTPAKKLIDMLLDNGGNVVVFDPWVDQRDAKGVTTAPRASSLENALKNADCIVVVTDQPEFKKIAPKYIKLLVKTRFGIVDGRRAFKPEEIIAEDIPYKSVGLGYSRQRCES
jgi:UDP-N-acetyl-D-mannosaminuronic acid dehydrogenase